MTLTKIITDTIDLSSDTTALKMPKGTTAQRPDGIDIDYLIVAGGGGGASTAGDGNGTGGGGAGGVLAGFTKVDGAAGTQTFDIEVGLGGAGGAATTSPADGNGNPGVNGNNSIFHSFTATGGGGGGNRSSNGLDGGSGGGSGCYGGSPYGLPGNATPGQGNNGGTGENASAQLNFYGGGGGGAGNAGSASVGGDGIVSSLITTSMAITYNVGDVDSSKVYFAGGGGGGRWTNGSGTGTGGLGGGGTGGTSSDNKTAGSNGTGGGGGGASWYSGSYGTGYNGADGGSGVIILSTNEASAVVTAGVTVNGTAGAGTRSGLVNGDKYVYIITVATAGDKISFTQAPGDVPDTVPVVGTMRENTTTGKMEIYTGAKGWRALQQTGQDVGVVPSNNFKTALYTGNATNNSVNIGFDADLTWIKNKGATGYHILFDTLRGLNEVIHSDNNLAQQASGMSNSYSNGTLSFSGSYTWGNKLNNNYVAWGWKAGGVPTTTNVGSPGGIPTLGSVMTDGVASTSALAGTQLATKLSVNTHAGFSITEVQYGTGEYLNTVPHGFSSRPDLIITKVTDTTSDWIVIADKLFGTGSILKLNLTNTIATDSTFSSTSTTFTTGYSTGAYDLIAYSFKSIPGYSLIGSYTGTGSATESPIIYTGFEPGWIMIKNTNNSINSWGIADNKRNTSNPRNLFLFADADGAETTYEAINFYNNGFQIRSTANFLNQAGNKFLFMCFAS